MMQVVGSLTISNYCLILTHITYFPLSMSCLEDNFSVSLVRPLSWSIHLLRILPLPLCCCYRGCCSQGFSAGGRRGGGGGFLHREYVMIVAGVDSVQQCAGHGHSSPLLTITWQHCPLPSPVLHTHVLILITLLLQDISAVACLNLYANAETFILVITSPGVQARSAKARNVR